MNSRQLRSISGFSRVTLVLALFALLLSGRVAAQSPQPTGSAAELQALAERGNSNAQYRLSKDILTHNPSPSDIQSGLKWLRASAAQENPNAEFYLGYLYEHGQFVQRDYALAFSNYEAAARVHYVPAENNLGSLYQHGQGVPRNMAKAFEWYLSGAQHGDPIAQLNLANLYYGGDGVPRDNSEAVRWLQRSAEAGLPDAQNNLAYFYFYGIVVQRDYTEAARLVRLAAEKNLPAAETSLGYLYEQGKGVALDYVAAYSWYSRASAGGDQAGEKHRKQLAQVMTRKQIDEANANVAASGSQAGQKTAWSSSAFSLVNH